MAIYWIILISLFLVVAQFFVSTSAVASVFAKSCSWVADLRTRKWGRKVSLPCAKRFMTYAPTKNVACVTTYGADLLNSTRPQGRYWQ